MAEAARAEKSESKRDDRLHGFHHLRFDVILGIPQEVKRIYQILTQAFPLHP